MQLAGTYRRQRTADPTHDVALFATMLRVVGVAVPMVAVLTATRALDLIRLERRTDFEAALRACLTTSTDEGATFDVVFSVFWSADEVLVLADPQEETRDQAQEGGSDVETSGLAMDGVAVPGRSRRHGSRRATYSVAGSPERSFTVDALRDRRIDDSVRRLARALGTARSRRRRSGSSGDLVDVRDSLRHNLRFGEEVLALRRSYPRRERARVVVLCDVSSSMLPYTPLFLAFVHALTRVVRTVEAAIFNVETSFVTDVFRRRTLAGSMAWLEAHSVVLAGGTRTGHCLRSFTSSLETRGVLRPGTTAIILSDGWDVGEPELLQAEMRRLRRQVGRLVWLDPHAAATGYKPQVNGLCLALPYVDDYVDFSGVDALEDLVSRLCRAPSVARKERFA